MTYYSSRILFPLATGLGVVMIILLFVFAFLLIKKPDLVARVLRYGLAALFILSGIQLTVRLIFLYFQPWR